MEIRELEERSGRRRRRQIWPVVWIGLAVMIVLALVIYLIVVLAGKNDAEEASAKPRTYTQEEVDALLAAAKDSARAEEAERILSGIQANFESGQATIRALREFYPEHIVLASDGRVRFYPIQEQLKQCTYSQEQLIVQENGELQYTENGQIVSEKGIDVSNHQGEIDWAAVAQDGVKFAVLRVGLRGYGTGKIVVDQQFENNVKGALSNGIEVGVYFYSQSVNKEEALEEAKLVLEQIAPYRITGPVVYDAEKVSDSRTSGLTGTERTDMAIAFCEAVAQAGYRPMIYLNLDTAFTVFELERLEEYDKWLAHYTDEMYYPYEYEMWQYSESGTVSGIKGKVDMNIRFRAWE